jgi:very-short-patch-repair endonuclease
MRAAQDGIVLTCVTEARRQGLWVLNDDGCTHAGVASNGRSPGDERYHLHWSVPPVPRHPDSVVDAIGNVLALVAECLPHDEALAVWESALNKGLVSLEAMGRLPLRPAARALCAEAVPWPDSGLESFMKPRLKFLRLPIRHQIWIAGHRVDFLIGDRLVLQIDGGTHTGSQRDLDNAHDAALQLMGYHVIRVGYRQVVERWHEVQDLIMQAVAQGQHTVRN